MRAILVLLALLLVASGARASACPTDENAIPIATPVGTWYVDNELCQPECLFSVWVIEETNGEPGLQRCGEEDPCTGCEADGGTIIL